jgi:hypothetical protein
VEHRPNKPLVPYASDVALGSGRTPVGIILFAAGHLLLGAALALWAAIVVPRLIRFRGPEPAFFILGAFAAIIAVSALLGGCALLIKGRFAWGLSVISFTLLGIGEAIGCAFGAGMLVRFFGIDRTGMGLGLFVAGVMTSLMVLSITVLSYLRGQRARITFALPPGESPLIARWMPSLVITAYILCAALATLLARSDFWRTR